MDIFTNDETDLLCIYKADTRQAAIEALTKLRGYLQDDETELRGMTRLRRWSVCATRRALRSICIPAIH